MDAEVKVNVYADLLKAAQAYTPQGQSKFKAQTKNETDAQYLERLLAHVAEIPEADYDKLPQEVQDWFQAAGEAFNGGKTIPAPEGFSSSYVSEKSKPVIAKEKAPAAAKEAKEKPAAEAKEPSERKPRAHNPDSIGAIIRRAVIANQAVKPDEVMKLLEEKGKAANASTVSSWMTDVRSTLQAAQEMGWTPPA